MKIKTAAIILMIGSIIWIITSLYKIIGLWTSYKTLGSWAFPSYDKMWLFILVDIFTILVPISLLIFSIAMIKNKKS